MIDPFAPRSPQTIVPEPGRVYVLCEGPDDAATVRAIARREGLDVVAATASPGFGLDTEIKAFADNAARQGVRALGVVKDKETDGAAERQRVGDWLRKAGLALPDGPGAMVQPAKEGIDLRLGYFLNPDIADDGAIEGLFVDQITPALLPCVEGFVECVEATGEWTERPSKHVLRGKVRLRAYLAARQAGGNTTINSALHAKHLTVEGPAFAGLRDFLRRLCA